jgi:orotidine-5'-phosphate decarboxylase
MEVFADRLIHAVRRLGPLCVGIDPHPALLPTLFGPPGPDAAASWGIALVERCVGKVAVVKPQAGLFERWGAKGMGALESVCRAATQAGLIVILDAKRGDIGTTAEGYAEGYLGEAANCPCDAITVNPYMGIDTIEPFVRIAERTGKGIAVLARTSNPGAADFQARLVDGQPLYLHVARALQPLVVRLRVGPDDGRGRHRPGRRPAPAGRRRRRAVPCARLWRTRGGGKRCPCRLCEARRP